jgi:hypothetical protein
MIWLRASWPERVPAIGVLSDAAPIVWRNHAKAVAPDSILPFDKK